MLFNDPAGQNLFDRSRVVGQPHHRTDGPLKVTGTAPYAYERHDVVQGQLYGYPVGSTISHGRIASMNAEAARAAGVALRCVFPEPVAPISSTSVRRTVAHGS